MNGRWLNLAWSLVINLMVLVGVIALQWPPGNVFLLFWAENAILGLVTAVMVQTATGVASSPPSGPTPPRWVQTGFFVVHYGIFLVVHAAFVAMVAFSIGVSLSFWALALPVGLILLRYAVDLAGGWFAGGQRRRLTSSEAMALPYPRLIVLHLATLLGFGVVMLGVTRNSPWSATLRPTLQWLAAHGVEISAPVLAVGLLMVFKSISDAALILRGPLKLTSVQFSTT